MDNKPKILAIIPARGGSKGVPDKNIKQISGKPLLAYTIEAAKRSKYIDRLVISTEDKKIADVAKEFRVQVIDRPKELAQDETPTNPVLTQVVNFLEKKENYFPDLVITLSPTCPLRKVKHIDESIEKFISEDYDSLIGVIYLMKHFYEIDQNNYLIPQTKERKNRQERKPVILENGAIYISKIDLIKKEKILGEKIGYYEMDYKSSINIDTPSDFFIAEKFLIDEKEQKDEA